MLQLFHLQGQKVNGNIFPVLKICQFIFSDAIRGPIILNYRSSDPALVGELMMDSEAVLRIRIWDPVPF
jgi:hypothetical protein